MKKKRLIGIAVAAVLVLLAAAYLTRKSPYTEHLPRPALSVETLREERQYRTGSRKLSRDFSFRVVRHTTAMDGQASS
jgi:hypothetical protein